LKSRQNPQRRVHALLGDDAKYFGFMQMQHTKAFQYTIEQPQNHHA